MVLFSTNTCQHLSFLVFLNIGILRGMGQYLTVALIWISLMINDVDIFSCICWPSVYILWKYMYLILCSFFNQIVFFGFCCCYWAVWVLYIFWILTLISDTIYKYFLPFIKLPFHFVDDFLCLCNLMQSHLFIFSFVAFCVRSKRSLPRLTLRKLLAIFY